MENTHKKTYGVEGLIDWQTEIKVGRARLAVSFTGGGMTSFGVTPAMYTTDNILYQHIIENSDPFKRGKIRLVRSVPLGEQTPTRVKSVEPAKKFQEVESVRNCSDARMWLKEHKGISFGAKTKAEVIQIAEANGVRFPKLLD